MLAMSIATTFLLVSFLPPTPKYLGTIFTEESSINLSNIGNANSDWTTSLGDFKTYDYIKNKR